MSECTNTVEVGLLFLCFVLFGIGFWFGMAIKEDHKERTHGGDWGI